MRAKTLLALLVLLSQATHAQKWNEKEVPVNQPSASVSLSMGYRIYATVEGQIFTCKVKNLTSSKINVTFDLLAYTLCGNTVSKHIVMEFDPGETIGAGGVLADQYAGFVKNSDCKGEKFRYHSQDLNMDLDGTNRIRTLGYQNFVVKIFPAASAATKGKPATKATGANDKPAESGNKRASAITGLTPANTAQQQAGVNQTTTAVKPVGSMVIPSASTTPYNQMVAAQNTTAAINTVVDGFGSLIIRSMEAKQAKWDKFSDQQIYYLNSPSNKRLLDRYKRSIPPDSAVIIAMQAAFDHVCSYYNWIDLDKISRYGTSGDDKERSALNTEVMNYFPKFGGSRQEYNIPNLPAELPDLLQIPLCHCFTDPKYTRPIDSAFYYLRNSAKCKKLSFQGGGLNIKFNKTILDHIDEDKAYQLLKSTLPKMAVNNFADAIDVENARIWLLYLDNKKAKTVSDLINGPDLLNGMPSSSVIGHTDEFYQLTTLMLEKYFRALYKYRLWYSNATDEEKREIPGSIVYDAK